MPNLIKKSVAVDKGRTYSGADFELLPRKFDEPLVYVFGLCGTNFVKIGSSSNIKSRFTTIQVATPLEVVVHSMTCPPDGIYHIEVEMLAHRILAEYRVRGEWFNLDHIKATAAVLDAAYGILLMKQ